MRTIWLALVVAASALSVNPLGAQGLKKDYPISTVPFTNIKVTSGFWYPRLETNRTVSIPYCFKMCEDTGRIANFAIAGGLEKGEHKGAFFNDSDVAKIVEGAAYSLAVKRDPKLEKYVDGVIDKIVAAQEKDGYLYTARTLMTPEKMPPGGKERWSDIGHGHELYNVGHMYEAAVAYYQVTGKRKLLDGMIKNADLVCSVFNEAGRHDPTGHQEIEIGLAKLYRATGDDKYLKQAKFFIDQRGRKGHRGLDGNGGLYGEYSQDHKPVLEQDEAIGHAVRATYLYAGMADVAALTGDKEYITAVDKLWDNVVGKKLYITGAIGASRARGEAFGDNYELPNYAAYNETCASIANCLWNHRMFLLHGDSKYIDVLERTLYNGLLSGVALEGNKFFYPNPVGTRSGTGRSPWFDCACCPSNICRFMPSIPGYAYAVKGTNVYVNLFIEGMSGIKTTAGWVRINQETDYPWDGAMKMTVTPQNKNAQLAISIRIPGWARNEAVPSDLYRFLDKSDSKFTLKVNGKPVQYKMSKGYAVISRAWKKGDVIQFDLPMPVRRVVANEKVVADKGLVALQRGPIVYIVENIDVPNTDLFTLLLPDDVQFTTESMPNLLGGVVAVKGKAYQCTRDDKGAPSIRIEKEITAIPYYAWAHRGRTPAVVWFAREDSAVQAIPASTVSTRAKVTTSANRGPAKCLSDQLIPYNSQDDSVPSMTWWPRNGEKEWVEYAFDKPEKVSKAKVYWFDDGPYAGVRIPESWQVLYKDGNDWKPVKNLDPYGVDKNKLHEVRFGPVETTGIRFEIQSIKTNASGLYEASVE